MTTQTAKELTRSLKRDPSGNCFDNLGPDGVYRIYHSSFFDSPPTYEIIDAVRLSPDQIKELLDRTPFDQATEDIFRGVDGRVVSEKDMFDPPEHVRPERPTEEQLREMDRKIEQHQREGVKKDPNAVCGLKQSEYNIT